nr:putative metalloprotease Tcis_Metallo_11 [Tityus cisandinus]
MLVLAFLINVSILIGVSAVRSVGREEIVFPSVETSRSGEKRLDFRALNQDVKLKLEAAGDVFGEGFFVKFAHDGKSEIPELNIEDIKRSLYKDKRTGASLHIADKEPLLIKGIINDNLRIEPIQSEDARRDGAIPHRVYEVISNDESYINDAVLPTDYHPVLDESLEELKPGETIFVEIGIVTDVAFTDLFRFPSELITYLTIFLNGVQCRFDNMRTIRVKLRLCNIQMNKYKREQPYIENNINNNLLMSDGALNSFREHMVSNSNISTDITILMSKLKMEDRKGRKDVLGKAYVAGACSQTSKFGIVSDQAYYEGVRTFAHETGHLLGCSHDYIESNVSSRRPYGFKFCLWDDGYIMSYKYNIINRNYFSVCCEWNITALANQNSCLREINLRSYYINSNEKPGENLETMLNLSAFKFENDKFKYYTYRCYKIDHLEPFNYPNGTCEFSCRTAHNQNETIYFSGYPCLDGEMCDVGKRCHNGVCQ